MDSSSSSFLSPSPTPAPRPRAGDTRTNTLLRAALQYITTEGGRDTPERFVRRVRRVNSILLRRIVPTVDDAVDPSLLRQVEDGVAQVMRDFEEGRRMAAARARDESEDEAMEWDGGIDAEEELEDEDPMVRTLLQANRELVERLERVKAGRARSRIELYRAEESDEEDEHQNEFSAGDVIEVDSTEEEAEKSSDEETRASAANPDHGLIWDDESEDEEDEEESSPPEPRPGVSRIPPATGSVPLQPRQSDNLDNVEVERVPKYGGPNNSTEYWHRTFPPILPFSETPLLAHWESLRIDADLRAFAAAGDKVVTNEVPLEAAMGAFKDLGRFESGSKFKMPKINPSLAALIAKTFTNDVMMDRLAEIADHGRNASEEKNFLPSYFLDRFLVNPNAAQHIRHSINKSPISASKTSGRIRIPETTRAPPVVRDPLSTADDDLPDEVAPSEVMQTPKSRPKATESSAVDPLSVSSSFRVINRAVRRSKRRSLAQARSAIPPAPGTELTRSKIAVVIPPGADSSSKTQTPAQILSKRKRTVSDVGILSAKRPGFSAQKPTSGPASAPQRKVAVAGEDRQRFHQARLNQSAVSSPGADQRVTDTQKKTRSQGAPAAGYEHVKRSALRSGKSFKPRGY